MLPDELLSSVPLPDAFRSPRDRLKEPHVDYELGGVALNDPSEGLEVKVWRCRYEEPDFIVDAPGVAASTLLSVAGVSEFQFTFDQNMQPAIAYRIEAGSRFYWFDATIPGFTTIELPAGSRSPRCSLDDKRSAQTSISDMILAYIRGPRVYWRAQRDRFLVEYVAATDAGEYTNALMNFYQLGQIGMNASPLPRFQFQLQGRTFRDPEVVPNPSPTIASVDPSSVEEGSEGFTLTVTGSGFIEESVVRWNDADRVTTYVSGAELEAAILEADVADAGTATVSVNNPSPGGGNSNGVEFTIEDVPTDPFFASVVALLHCDGPDESTTLVDVTGKTWTANGDAQLDTAQSKFGTASLLLDGAGDYIESADSPDFSLADSAFTFECFVRFTSDPSSPQCIASHYLNTGGQRAWLLQFFTGDILRFQYSADGSTLTTVDAAWNPAVDTWYHVAVCRSGADLRMFVDGTQVGSTHNIGAVSIFDSNQPLVIGALNSSGFIRFFDGWIDELRLSNGVARYTGNFVPPNEPFPNSGP